MFKNKDARIKLLQAYETEYGNSITSAELFYLLIENGFEKQEIIDYSWNLRELQDEGCLDDVNHEDWPNYYVTDWNCDTVRWFYNLDTAIEYCKENSLSGVYSENEKIQKCYDNKIEFIDGLHFYILDLEDDNHQFIIARDYKSAYNLAHEYMNENYYDIGYYFYDEDNFEINEIQKMYDYLVNIYGIDDSDDGLIDSFDYSMMR